MFSSDNKLLPVGTIVISVLFLLVMLLTYLLVKPSPPPVGLQGVISKQYHEIYDFNLATANGKFMTQDDLQGKWSFIFFGYTSCPDICPMTLHILSQVKQLLADENRENESKVQVVFISIDPNRDSPEKIKEYVSYFDKRFLAATGDETSLQNFSRQFGAGFIVEPETAPGSYHVIHTSAIFLVDPLLRRVATFSQPHYAATIHQQFNELRAYFSGDT